MLVDVTPSAPERHEQMTKAQMGTVALVQGDRTFPSFQAMLDVTIAAAPHRDRDSLRRGVFHNSKQLDDGNWTWRYDTFRKGDGFEACGTTCRRLTVPTTLVRGANSFFVNDDDADEFARTAPGFQRVIVVPDSGHSVQGDQPRALVEILRGVLGRLSRFPVVHRLIPSSFTADSRAAIFSRHVSGAAESADQPRRALRAATDHLPLPVR